MNDLICLTVFTPLDSDVKGETDIVKLHLDRGAKIDDATEV